MEKVEEQQEQQAQQITESEANRRYMYAKLDCELRAKSLEIAMTLPTSNDVKSLLHNGEEVGRYIFGTPKPVEEKK